MAPGRRIGSALRVEGAEVSAVEHAEAGALEVRVFNPTDSETTVALPSRFGMVGRPERASYRAVRRKLRLAAIRDRHASNH